MENKLSGCECRMFNTGDTVWVRDGKTVAVITHDGIIWGEDFKEFFLRIQGFDKILHRMSLVFVRLGAFLDRYKAKPCP